jgi:hypothetical protein
LLGDESSVSFLPMPGEDDRRTGTRQCR